MLMDFNLSAALPLQGFEFHGQLHGVIVIVLSFCHLLPHASKLWLVSPFLRESRQTGMLGLDTDLSLGRILRNARGPSVWDREVGSTLYDGLR